MLDKIRKALEQNPRITSWIVTRKNRHVHQLFSSFGTRESIRVVDDESYHVELFTPVHSANSNAQNILSGSIQISLLPGERDIEGKIEDGVEKASIQGNPPYRLTPGGLSYPDFCDADLEIKQNPWNTMDALTDRLEACTTREKHISISSSEFFLTYLERRLINSEGVDVCSEHTDLLWDICLLYQNGHSDTEYWEIYSVPGLKYFRMEQDFQRFAKYAQDAAKTEIPRSGECPVVLTGDALSILLQYFQYHSSAMARFSDASLFRIGEPVIPDEIRGESLTIYSNALVPGASHSYRFDSEGLPGRRVPIITDGRLVQYWATKQYADYLGMEPTGDFANFEIPPGNTSWNDLLRSRDRVILVVQFSTFDPQPVAGNYLGEIRTGYEFRSDGSVVPLRGGSVTGNVVSGMRHCTFCREMETFRGYFGPRGIRFEKAQIAGL